MSAQGMQTLAGHYQAARNWLFETALPFWASTGVDRVHGGFFERLTPEGDILPDNRRTRLVGRQIYVFAMAEKLGWPGPARDLVRHGLGFLLEHCIRPDGTVVSVVGEDGQVLNPDFDLYDHAFALFGLAAAAGRGERTEELAQIAVRMREAMVAGWKHPTAGFEESQPRTLPLKANPHMHMLEASLAWMEVRPDDGWGLLADEIAELCLARFLAPDTGALMEFFDGDWQALTSPDDAVVEPGHQLEWAWLLTRWGLLRGRPDALEASGRLRKVGEEDGADTTRDLVINELNADLSVRDDRARLWPQTERTKAHVIVAATAESAGEADVAAHLAARALQGLRRYFEHPVSGSWWEHIDRDGHPAPEPARASSLYHIVCALTEVDTALKTMEKREV